jgi:hypothetical protein
MTTSDRARCGLMIAASYRARRLHDPRLNSHDYMTT